MKRLRLLKVIIQPVLVIDDEDGLSEGPPIQPITVSAKDWPVYATTTFVADFEVLRQQVEADGA